MKKLISLLLMLALLISSLALVSCDEFDSDADKEGSSVKNPSNSDDDDDEESSSKKPKTKETLADKTPEELYELAMEKLEDTDEFSITSTQLITINYEGQSLDMTQTMIQKFNGDDGYVKTMSDNTLNYETWYVDGVSYVNMEGYKIKCALSKEDYMEQYMEADPQESTLLDIPESWFTDIKFTKSGSDWVLKFDVDADQLNNLLGNIGMEYGTIDDDVIYRVFFDDEGNMKKVTMEFDMTIEMYGETYTAHCTTDSIVVIENVTIELPDDAHLYEEVYLD